MDEIRKLFANTKEAKLRGYKGGKVLFYVHKGARCEQVVRGGARLKLEMHFLTRCMGNWWIVVEGKGFNSSNLKKVYIEGKSYGDVSDIGQ